MEIERFFIIFNNFRMVSGGVAVPHIAPRHLLAKGIIDSNTIIDMHCPNFPSATIFYSTDGSK